MSPQHLDALAIATERRLARSRLRHRIQEAGGDGNDRRIPHMRGNAMLQAAHELEPRPVCLHSLEAFAFLRWSCKPLEARALMARADIVSELRTISELTDRQLQVLVAGLRIRAAELGAREERAA